MAEPPDYEALLDEAKNNPEEQLLSEKREQQRIIEGLGRRPVVVPLLVAINLIVFVAMLASGVSAVSPLTMDILNWGGNFAPLTLTGQWWRLWTSMFVHIGFLHVLMNMVVLWDAGKIVERLIGRTGFFVMYAVSGLLGSVASLAWNDNLVSAGASGAVFGVFGCLLGLLLRDRRSVPDALRARLGKMALILVGYNLLFGAAAEGIDMAAHIGGLVGGFVCGVVLALPIGEDSAIRRRARSGVLAAIGLLAVSVGAFALPTPSRSLAVLHSSKLVKVGETEVFYTKGVTRDQATGVSEVLVSMGFFDRKQRASALVSKDKGQYTVGLVVLEGTAENAALEGGFRSLAASMSAQVFDGEAVVVALLDNRLNTVRRLEPIDAKSLVQVGQQPDFLLGVNWARLRSSALVQRYEPALVALLHGAQADGLPASCGWSLLSQLRFTSVRHYPGPENRFRIVFQGIARSTMEACIADVGSEEAHVTNDGDLAMLVAGDVSVALRWPDDESFFLDFANAESGDFAVVGDPEKLALGADEALGYQTSQELARDAGEIADTAVVWLATTSPMGTMQMVVSEGIKIDGRLVLPDEAAADRILDLVRAASPELFDLPSVTALLTHFEISNEGGVYTLSAAMTEQDLMDVVAAFANDEALDALFLE